MGVTGLWTVVQPCARPIKLEALNKKRLAVDASIWIYQFLKAVRDKEGNALRNSHVVGFFRRICKLLFFGIKPVFVFDGGAPALKRQTIAGRKQRREGRREDAVRTAGKLLAVQMQRRAEEDAAKEKRVREGRTERAVNHDAEEEVPENPVYVDELQMTQEERQQNRTFRKKDQYHLPDLNVSLENMGAPDDPRIMSHEELEEYARQFHSGEDINLYDFSKIDFNSPFFLSLPASDRYNILNAARLRSRLRMGYSKDQLDDMFPDRMAFSRFQIERVAERNELTQRLMNINGMNGEDAMFGINGVGRVAGEKSKEYVLVKNDGVEGGWVLGVFPNKEEGERNKPIEIDGPNNIAKPESDDERSAEEEDGFEDVPIEGLNRLPKRKAAQGENMDEHGLFQSRRNAGSKSQHELRRPENDDADSLFVTDSEHENVGYANHDHANELSNDGDMVEDDEDEDLNRAIAMSLEGPGQHQPEIGQIAEHDGGSIGNKHGALPETSGKAVGRAAHQRSNAAPFDLDDSDVEEMETIEQDKKKPDSSQIEYSYGQRASAFKAGTEPVQEKSTHAALFDGPLPFERLDFGKSLLGAKKAKDGEDTAGGFEKEQSTKALRKPKAKPLPPWFSSDIHKDVEAQRSIEERQFDGDEERHADAARDQPILKRQETGDVIDVQSSAGDSESDLDIVEALPIDSEVRMGDVADLARAEPPTQLQIDNKAKVQNYHVPQHSTQQNDNEPFDWDDSDRENQPNDKGTLDITKPAGGERTDSPSKSPSPVFENVALTNSGQQNLYSQEGTRTLADPIAESAKDPASRSPSPLFEDVDIEEVDERQPRERADESLPNDLRNISPSVHDAVDETVVEEDDFYSDPEDDELMQQLAVEAEEHARFASELNNKSKVQNQEDYERELRALRSQQKKDRRDADEVSQIMITECQQLLKLFGLPYVTAPMEAEAQCAELVSLGLVDGIVTDDSDCFLFGGTRIYKNMFNQAKFVECYLSSDLEKEFDLDRNKLIRVAHLLGSDYTDGIPGVGPVTALEILSEFNSDNGLEDFRDWWQAVQTGRHMSEDASSRFRKKFRRNAGRLFLPPSFPSPAVTQAYLDPEVDSSRSPFEWGVPDLDSLRSFLMATIGWSQERTDEVLVPVVRDMNRRENEGTQSNLTAYFAGEKGAPAFAPRRRDEGLGKTSGKVSSRRMVGALGKLAEGAKRKRTRGRSGAEGEASHASNVSSSGDEDAAPTGDATKTALALSSESDGHSSPARSKPPRKGRKTGGKGNKGRARA
ncbi:MAG: DNA repair protein rad2 [Piccolia ochrophora]|nr:MAG: DNA repair protein rad2 [Piccolia ochrophora]